MKKNSFDPIWEEKYKLGHSQRAPWDIAVSFIYRYAPRDIRRSNIKILEVGCGTAGTLLFAAKEGFNVSGLDASQSAINAAQKRFKEDGLFGDLVVGDFIDLPYKNEKFDLVIDRTALTCAGTTSIQKAISEIHRVLKPSGKFLFTPISDQDSGLRVGTKIDDDLITDIRDGDLQYVGQLRFVSRSEIDMFLPDEKWEINSLLLSNITDMKEYASGMSSNWQIISTKK